MDPTELAHWLAEAWSDYQGSWAVVDRELYDLCARKGHDRLEDVYAKVAIINRVYMAGITRSVRAVDDADAELRVSRLLVRCADELSAHLAHLREINDLTAETMATVVTAHGSITQRLAADLQATNLCSFVSKYLHFHCPMVPIYDSRVAEHIVEVLGEHVPRSARTERLLDRPRVFHPSYYWYAGRFLRLWQLARESTPEATVKMLDHALWR
ncbi:MAG: hypothetical protein JXA57_16915 [Armatimonadetes bacterium]|nr:hypothetical protein [Armatimonadota bacterium]